MSTRLPLYRRAGWWGTTIFLGSLFFALGTVVSLLNGEFGVAFQGIIVSALLLGVSVVITLKRPV